MTYKSPNCAKISLFYAQSFTNIDPHAKNWLKSKGMTSARSVFTDVATEQTHLVRK